MGILMFPQSVKPLFPTQIYTNNKSKKTLIHEFILPFVSLYDNAAIIFKPGLYDNAVTMSTDFWLFCQSLGFVILAEV